MSDDNIRRISLADLPQLHTVLQNPHDLGRLTTTGENQKLELSSDTSVRCLQSTCPLDMCDGTGFYLKPVKFGHPDFGKMHYCDCRTMNMGEKRRARITRILATLEQDMGSELAAATLDTYDISRACADNPETAEEYRATMVAALDTCRRYVQVPSGWIFLYGPTGTGKSHLLCATARALAAQGRTVSYTSETELFPYLRDGFNRQKAHGDSEFIDADDRMRVLQEVEVLLLDDIGSNYRGRNDSIAGTWADTQIFNLLYTRHLKERFTLISSNLHIDDIEPRVRSRILGRTDPGFVGRQQCLPVLNTDQREGRHGH